MKHHFDVIVLGRSIGALVAAALLARRDFTVLVLGQGALAPTYRVDELTLHRRAFSFLGAECPAWRRVIIELAQSQTWKRRAVAAEPMLQAVAPGFRLDVPSDAALFAREVERQFPALRRVVEELHQHLHEVNEAADRAFEADVLWPPGTFWERRETAKCAAQLPYVHAEPDADLLGEFPRGHFYRQLVRAAVLYGTHLSTTPPPFAAARLFGSATRGLVRLDGGEAELESFLIERVRTHGGQCRLGDRAAALHLRRGVAAGVLVDGEDDAIGCEFVLTDLDGESLASLAGGQGIHKRALREWPRITSTVGRFVVSIVANTKGLPEPLGPEVLLFLAKNPWPTRARPPAIHLLRYDQSAEHTLLVAELLLPDNGAVRVVDARELILEAVLTELPFLERHLVLVDSPHDGGPIWRFVPGPTPGAPLRRVELDRTTFGLAPVEPMVRQLEVDPPGYLGLSGEPIRGPIERTLLVGRSVLPALGQEGELLAAWGAARLVTKADRRKTVLRRDMWTKLEFG